MDATEDKASPPDRDSSIDRILHALQERTKELKSLYTIEDVLRAHEKPFDELLLSIAEAIPAGWQYPDFCRARITLHDRTFSPDSFEETPWLQSAPIFLQGKQIG